MLVCSSIRTCGIVGCNKYGNYGTQHYFLSINKKEFKEKLLTIEDSTLQ